MLQKPDSKIARFFQEDILTGKKINWSTAVLENNSEASYSLLKKSPKWNPWEKFQTLFKFLQELGTFLNSGVFKV